MRPRDILTTVAVACVTMALAVALSLPRAVDDPRREPDVVVRAALRAADDGDVVAARDDHARAVALVDQYCASVNTSMWLKASAKVRPGPMENEFEKFVQQQAAKN